MKNTATILAKNNRRRHVVLDVTGKIHLTWDKKRVHLSQPNFSKLVKLLEDGVFELDLTRIGNGPYHFKAEDAGHLSIKAGKYRYPTLTDGFPESGYTGSLGG